MSHISMSLACRKLIDSSANSPHPLPPVQDSLCLNTTVEFLVFEAPTTKLHWMDYWSSQSFCCTEEMVNKKR